MPKWICTNKPKITLVVQWLIHVQLLAIQWSACSMPGFPVLYFLEFAHTHVHWVGDDIQPSHPLSSPSPPAFSLSQHQGLLQWGGSAHHVAKVLELQHQSSYLPFIFPLDFLITFPLLNPFSFILSSLHKFFIQVYEISVLTTSLGLLFSVMATMYI